LLLDGATDPQKIATEIGAEIAIIPDSALDATDVGASPDASTDRRDVGLTGLDLGTEAGGDGSTPSLPTSCIGQDLFVDVSDGHSSRRLLYSGSSAIPLATGKGGDVSFTVSENPNEGGTGFYVDLATTGPQSATTTRVSWTPAGQSKTMTDHCGSNMPVTITRFDTGGGILEGDFDHIAVGYSCEGIDATLSGHFRVCYIPTN
jgi:hypothetical protein